MSTVYNRRRGAKANRARTMRTCSAEGCIRVAPINRYCPDHQLTHGAAANAGRKA
jgi:hypothetical protein